MFSALNARLLVRFGVSRALVAPSRVVNGLSRRTFLTSPRIAFPAAVRPPKAVAAKKPAAKKPAAKKAAPKKAAAKKAAPKKKPAPKKAAPKRKVAAKKPAVKPKRRVVAKKPIAKKPPRVTRAQGPPSRGPTPFIVFASEYRATHTEGTMPERAAAAGAAWRALSEAERQPYYAQSAAKREVAKEAVAKYFSTVDPALLRRINAQRKTKKMPRIHNHTVPKRPMGPYLAFFMETRDASVSFEESAKIAGAAWKVLPQEEKDAYKNRYLEQYKVWKEQNPTASRISS
ncbi:hypothetical protein MSAN_00198300 [Mycena sanguinolenta]|uniref:HMG box domain-containing protein n=1 Tax=Mycena sanguinolenta TaxID=230812 RepID=A0A8H6ZEX7_9AGAR|nr:hypothetical protein MSAN_00198300 [Mycena sanguinolenta]